jgi:hypothetical protein
MLYDNSDGIVTIHLFDLLSLAAVNLLLRIKKTLVLELDNANTV